MVTLADTLRQVGYVSPQGQVTGPRTQLAQQLRNYATNVIPTAKQNLAQQRADIDAALTMGDQGIQIGDREAFERQIEQVPNLMGTFIGAGSKLWNPKNAFEAAKMLKKGVPETDVWKATGTVKGLENEFRQEIPDDLALLKGTGNFGQIYEHRKAMHGVTTPTAEEVMRHPELFEAYPELKSLQIQLLPATSRNNAVYSPTERVISINPKSTSEQARSSMLHELQHAIQESEGWNKGANAGIFLKKYQEQADELEERLMQANKDLKLHAGGKYYDDLLKERDAIGKEYRDFMGADQQGVIRKATQEYKAHGGEAEARLTQARQKLTADQRKEIFPFAKGKNALDINPEDAIIKMEHDSPTITRKEFLQQLMESKK
jgi:hypothetical protein